MCNGTKRKRKKVRKDLNWNERQKSANYFEYSKHLDSFKRDHVHSKNHIPDKSEFTLKNATRKYGEINCIIKQP